MLLKKIINRTINTMLSISPAFFFMIKLPYWGLVNIIIRWWGSTGLHSIRVGEFKGGASKTRSSYREDMLLKTMMLLLDIRGKSCLDLACNDGFWSFRLARLGAKSVKGIDMNRDVLVKANFLKHVYDYPGFRFVKQDIFNFLSNNKRDSYDIILLLSVLYHLPKGSNWEIFFSSLSKINNECLIIDSRWHEDMSYWHDPKQGILKTKKGIIKKWQPTRAEVIKHLYNSGYEHVVEVDPTVFIQDKEGAYGNGDPYSLENISDYMTNHRSLIFAYKKKDFMPAALEKIKIEKAEREK